MSLRDVAYTDLKAIMNDSSGGCDPCTVTAPDDTSDSFQVWSNDISLSIDPGTGVAVAGRQSSVSLLISELIEAGFDDITGETSPSSKPWRITYDDVNGRTVTWRVIESIPDHGSGLLVCMLELYG
jgi:hypothetical protein